MRSWICISAFDLFDTVFPIHFYISVSHEGSEWVLEVFKVERTQKDWKGSSSQTAGNRSLELRGKSRMHPVNPWLVAPLSTETKYAMCWTLNWARSSKYIVCICLALLSDEYFSLPSMWLSVISRGGAQVEIHKASNQRHLRTKYCSFSDSWSDMPRFVSMFGRRYEDGYLRRASTLIHKSLLCFARITLRSVFWFGGYKSEKYRNGAVSPISTQSNEESNKHKEGHSVQDSLLSVKSFVTNWLDCTKLEGWLICNTYPLPSQSAYLFKTTSNRLPSY